MRPTPIPTRLTEPYWRAGATGRLVLQWCGKCRRFQHFPEAACRTCGGDDGLEWKEIDGAGVIDACTVVHRTFAPGFGDRVPYVLAWVSLTARPGVRVFGNVLEVDPAQVHIGMSVELCFEALPDFGAIPNFRAAR